VVLLTAFAGLMLWLRARKQSYPTVVIGSRQSILAMWQTKHVKALLEVH
jgi:hypothetical protein